MGYVLAERQRGGGAWSPSSGCGSHSGSAWRSWPAARGCTARTSRAWSGRAWTCAPQPCSPWREGSACQSANSSERRGSMGEQEQGQSEGGGGERGKRGAKPCRVCRKFHWEVFEDTPGSGVWYARVWHKGLAGCAACQKRSGGHACKEKVGTHSLALKRAATWKVEVAEGRFFPKRVPPW